MSFGENALTIGIIFSLIVLVYLRWNKKTIGETIKEIREAMRDPTDG